MVIVEVEPTEMAPVVQRVSLLRANLAELRSVSVLLPARVARPLTDT